MDMTKFTFSPGFQFSKSEQTYSFFPSNFFAFLIILLDPSIPTALMHLESFDKFLTNHPLPHPASINENFSKALVEYSTILETAEA